MNDEKELLELKARDLQSNFEELKDSIKNYSVAKVSYHKSQITNIPNKIIDSYKRFSAMFRMSLIIYKYSMDISKMQKEQEMRLKESLQELDKYKRELLKADVKEKKDKIIDDTKEKVVSKVRDNSVLKVDSSKAKLINLKNSVLNYIKYNTNADVKFKNFVSDINIKALETKNAIDKKTGQIEDAFSNLRENVTKKRLEFNTGVIQKANSMSNKLATISNRAIGQLKMVPSSVSKKTEEIKEVAVSSINNSIGKIIGAKNRVGVYFNTQIDSYKKARDLKLAFKIQASEDKSRTMQRKKDMIAAIKEDEREKLIVSNKVKELQIAALKEASNAANSDIFANGVPVVVNTKNLSK